MEKRVEEEMRGTLHAPCAKRICSVFEKTRKGDLEWSVFMNTLRVRSRETSASKAPSECDRSTSKLSRGRHHSPPEQSQRQIQVPTVSMFGRSKLHRYEQEDDP